MLRSVTLFPFAKPLLSCHVKCSQIPGIKAWTFGGPFLPQQLEGELFSVENIHMKL